jgi:adenine-specific DNA methylase
MKYMGSKRAMLLNGLGDLIEEEILPAHRFVDLFTGSGAVACHVAERFQLPVLAVDLQAYCVVLVAAIISRETRIDWEPIWRIWHRAARDRFEEFAHVPNASTLTWSIVEGFRAWSSEQNNLAITKAYGGHYFSPFQAVWFDVLRNTLPDSEPSRTVALAALIQAASQCVGAPGHTAQPFKPTPTAKKWLEKAWSLDPVDRTAKALAALGKRHAKRLGTAVVGDANEVARHLNEGDLVFIDPPYSGVHYSRFYHVLETIAQGECGAVTGVGRYPSTEFRPQSRFSIKTQSAKALDELLCVIASQGAKAILTFPDQDRSNGLSGILVREIAAKYFLVSEQHVKSRLSTLGGTGDNPAREGSRSARQNTKELILGLRQR